MKRGSRRRGKVQTTPVDALQFGLEFFAERARHLKALIEKIEGDATHVKAAEAARAELSTVVDKMRQCAAELAPYMHGKIIAAAPPAEKVDPVTKIEIVVVDPVEGTETEVIDGRFPLPVAAASEQLASAPIDDAPKPAAAQEDAAAEPALAPHPFADQYSNTRAADGGGSALSFLRAHDTVRRIAQGELVADADLPRNVSTLSHFRGGGR